MLTPQTVLQARRWLELGRLREAARLLLEAPQKSHRDVVACREQVAAALRESARQRVRQGDRWEALADAQLAAQLAEPEGEDASFLRRLAREVEQEREHHESAGRVVEQAQRWCDAGRHAAAVRLIDDFLSRSSLEPQHPLRGRMQALRATAAASQAAVRQTLTRIRQLAEAGDRALAWKLCRDAIQNIGPTEDLLVEHGRIGRLYREECLRSAEWHLQEGNIEQAVEALKHASDVQRAVELPDDGQLAKLQRRLASLLPHHPPAPDPGLDSASHLFASTAKTSSVHPPRRSRAVRSRDQVFVLQEQWLVVSADDATIGHRTSQAAHVRLAARIGREHARIRRRGRRYHLFVSPGSRPVFVNDRPVSSGQLLQHGDRIRFEGAPGTWHFLFPVEGSATAVLYQEDPGGSTVAVRDGHGRCRGVILLADELVCTPRSTSDAHILINRLPGQLTLRWESDGLLWRCEDCIAQESDDDPGSTEGRVTVPSRLSLIRETSESEWLQELLQSGQDIDHPVCIRFDGAY